KPTQVKKNPIFENLNSNLKLNSFTPAADLNSIEVKSLTVSLDNQKNQIQNVDFTISQGSTLAIVGRNGSGKSTLLNALVGFVPIKSGQIILDPDDVTNSDIITRAKRISYNLQQPTLMISELTVLEEVKAPLDNFEVDNSEALAIDILKKLELYPYRNWPLTALSFGQLKRVTIASSIVLNPEILLLDEPTAGLDKQNQEILFKVLDELRKNGTTIIYVTHDMELATNFANKILLLKDGEVQIFLSSKEFAKDKTLLIEAELIAGGEDK
ncbi:MAG: energy-coupling factor ABC transporter ATP-binding protein, partial [Lactobacillaceae bacterium]|nr:energy-coupling factor ABC transporter ATP-binding protein [Lactobacillaceae bacterium]